MVLSPHSSRDDWRAALRTLLTRFVEFLETLRAELMEAVAHSDGLSENTETNAALEQVLERPDRNSFVADKVRIFKIFLIMCTRLSHLLEEVKTWHSLSVKFFSCVAVVSDWLNFILTCFQFGCSRLVFFLHFVLALLFNLLL